MGRDGFATYNTYTNQWGNFMKPRNISVSRVVLHIAAAGAVSACWLQPALAGQADPEAAARDNWRAVMQHNPASAAGCFHASYPSFVWEEVECKVAQPLVHPVHSERLGGAGEVTGNGKDYVAESAGLTSEALGSFPTVTGVTSEKSKGVAAFGDGGILGKNEYSLQANTNYTGTTSACAGHSGCTVWQQFIYATDYLGKGEAAAFMQYWLIGWGSSACPGSFASDGGGDCYTNSKYVSVADEPITDLAELTLSGAAVAGGNDTVVFNNGTEAYSVSGHDSVLDIASVWQETEFNIVGDAGGSRADFNTGASVTVKLAITDGTTTKPKCVKNAGSTGETNNFDLGKCTAAAGSPPYIEFTESN
jgi:hypothetical protein